MSESTNTDTGLILYLDGSGNPTPMLRGLEGYPTKNAAGENIHYRRVLVAPFGEWTHRGNGSLVNIDRARAEEWVKNAAALAAAGIKPFITPKHLYDPKGNFATPDARDTLGYVERLEAQDDGLYAITAIHGDENLKIAARNSRSIGIARNDQIDAKGKEYPGESMHHLACVPNPALPIAASADRPAITAPIYTLATAQQTAAPSRRSYKMSPELAKQAREKLGLAADVPDEKLDDSVATKALALSADVATLTTERDRFKQEAEATLALGADESKLKPYERSFLRSGIKDAGERVIKAGTLSPTGMKLLDEILLPGGKMSSMALALSAGSDDIFYKRICDILASNPGIKTDNAVPRDAKPVTALALDGDGADQQAVLLKQQLQGYGMLKQ